MPFGLTTLPVMKEAKNTLLRPKLAHAVLVFDGGFYQSFYGLATYGTMAIIFPLGTVVKHGNFSVRSLTWRHQQPLLPELLNTWTPKTALFALTPDSQPVMRTSRYHSNKDRCSLKHLEFSTYSLLIQNRIFQPNNLVQRHSTLVSALKSSMTSTKGHIPNNKPLLS